MSHRTLLAVALVLVLSPVVGVATAEESLDGTSDATSDGEVAASAARGAVVADAGATEDRAIDRALARAVSSTQDLPHGGGMTVVTFSDRGPQIAEIDLSRNDQGVRMVREGGDEVGRVDGTGFLSSSSELLRVGGVERVPAQLDRLRTKYAATLGATEELDTGPATPLVLAERDTEVVREVLYLDDATGLVVRRETFGRDGGVVRIVAYTSLDLELEAGRVAVPASEGREVREHEVAAGDAAAMREAGFVVPDHLPGGYELVAALEVPEAGVPTLHLIYGDGLYTLSVFQQQGRMKRTAVDGAARLHTPAGGAVWRWPGSEPRRVVWSGDGSTFTALADAPTDELIDVVAGLPIDPEPSTLDRLGRGLQRVGDWFARDDRSNT